MVPAEYCDAERLTGTERVVPGVPTHRVSGTKDSICGTNRVLGCRKTYWHRESGTRGVKGTEGYQHRVSGTKESTIWHNRLRFNAVFNCFYLFLRLKNLGGGGIYKKYIKTNIKENNPIEKVLNNGSKFDS